MCQSVSDHAERRSAPPVHGARQSFTCKESEQRERRKGLAHSGKTDVKGITGPTRELSDRNGSTRGAKSPLSCRQRVPVRAPSGAQRFRVRGRARRAGPGHFSDRSVVCSHTTGILTEVVLQLCKRPSKYGGNKSFCTFSMKEACLRLFTDVVSI